MNEIFSTTQLATLGIIAVKFREAIEDRNEEMLLSLIPKGEDDPKSDYCLMLYGAISALLSTRGTSTDFNWVMGTICYYRGYEEFVAMYWISRLQCDAQKEASY